MAIPIAFSLGVGAEYGIPNLFWDGDHPFRQGLVGAALALLAMLLSALAVSDQVEVSNAKLSTWVKQANEVLGPIGRYRTSHDQTRGLDSLWRIWLALLIAFVAVLSATAVVLGVLVFLQIGILSKAISDWGTPLWGHLSTLSGWALPAGALTTAIAGCLVVVWLDSRKRSISTTPFWSRVLLISLVVIFELLLIWPTVNDLRLMIAAVLLTTITGWFFLLSGLKVRSSVILAGILINVHVLLLKSPGLAGHVTTVGALCLILSELAILVHFTVKRPMIIFTLLVLMCVFVPWVNRSPRKLTIPGLSRYYFGNDGEPTQNQGGPEQKSADDGLDSARTKDLQVRVKALEDKIHRGLADEETLPAYTSEMKEYANCLAGEIRREPAKKETLREYARALLGSKNLDPALVFNEYKRTGLTFDEDIFSMIFEELLHLENLGINVKSVIQIADRLKPADPAGKKSVATTPEQKANEAKQTEAFAQAVSALADMYVMDFDGAREKLDRALANDPRNSLYYYFRAHAHAAMGNSRVAIEDLRNVKHLRGRLSDVFFARIGVVEMIKTKVDNSITNNFLRTSTSDFLVGLIKIKIIETFNIKTHGLFQAELELDLIKDSLRNRMYGLASDEARKAADEMKAVKTLGQNDTAGLATREEKGAALEKEKIDEYAVLVRDEVKQTAGSDVFDKIVNVFDELAEVLKLCASGNIAGDETLKKIANLNASIPSTNDSYAKSVQRIIIRLDQIRKHLERTVELEQARQEPDRVGDVVREFECAAQSDRDDDLTLFALADALRLLESHDETKLQSALRSAKLRLERAQARREYEVVGKFQEEIEELPKLIGINPKALGEFLKLASSKLDPVDLNKTINHAFSLIFNQRVRPVTDWRKSFRERRGTEGLVSQAIEYVDDLESLENWLALREKSRVGAPADRQSTSIAAKAPVLVVVATSGGGIAAAVWTASCLAEIEKEYPDFPYHIKLVTGASGGMVGAGPYIASLKEPGKDPDRKGRLSSIVDAVAEDSLTPTVRRTLLADLPSLLCFKDQSNDRGRVLEGVWERNWSDHLGLPKGLTLYDLAQGERDGWRPSLVVSPTLIEENHFLVISNLDFIGRGGDLQFFRLYPASRKEMTLATALRLNASFPLISPAANLPSIEGNKTFAGSYVPMRRVVDAGLLDNFGVELACRWIEQRKSFLYANTSGVLLLRLEAFPDNSASESTSGREKGTRADYTPVDWMGAFYGTYRKTMSERNKEAITELKNWFNDDYPWPSDMENPGFLQEIVLSPAPKGIVPLGWKLSKVDREKVELASYRGGYNNKNENAEALVAKFKQVLRFLDPRSSPASSVNRSSVSTSQTGRAAGTW